MALSPAEKKRLDAMLREIEEDLEKAAAIDKPTTAKEALDVFGTALGQSISMNLLDEAVATYGGLTPEERAEANKSIEEARNRTLGTAAAGLAGDIVGAIPAGIGAAKLAGGKALRLLGLGAAEGAISGAGAGETPEERLLGGAIGGTIGLGAGAAGIAGGKLHRYISSQKQMTEELQRLAREQAEEQIRKEAAKASSEKLAKEAAPTRFKVKEEKVPEKPAEIIPEVDIPDVNEGYQLALERFKPVTTAEKTDGPILIKAGLAPLQTPRQLPTGTKSAVDTGYTMSSEVGKGSYGTVYRVVDEKGQPKVAKVSQDPVLNDPEFKATLKHEKDLANEITALRKSANREEQKYLRHFPKFERVLENPDDPTGGYLIVMDELRPMNDYELAALFKGRSYLEDIILKLKNPYGLDPVTNVIRSTNDFILPSSHKLRRPLTEVDYENMPLNVRKFYKALEWLADEKNIKWDDLYDSNVMIDPKTGEYVAVDLGQFTLKGKEPPTARSTGTLQKSLGAPGLDTRKRAEEAARKERQRFRTEETESLPSEIPPRSLSAAAGKSKTEAELAGQTEMFSEGEMGMIPEEDFIALGLDPSIRNIADLRPEIIAGNIKSAETRLSKMQAKLKRLGGKDDVLEQEIEQTKRDLFELKNVSKAIRKPGPFTAEPQPTQQTALDLARQIAAQPEIIDFKKITTKEADKLLPVLGQQIIQKRKNLGIHKDITVDQNGRLLYSDGSPVAVLRGTRVPAIFATKTDIPDHPRPPETYFFSDNPVLANTYAKISRANPGYVFEADVRMYNPLIIDGKGTLWNKIPFEGKIVDTNDIAARAKELGYDGVIIKDIQDVGLRPGGALDPEVTLSNVIISLKKDNVLSHKQINKEVKK